MAGAIKGIALDLEGTVIDTEKLHQLGFIRAAADFRLTLTMEDCFHQFHHFRSGPDDQVAWGIARLASEGGLVDPIDYKDVLKAKRKHYKDILKEIEIKPRLGFLDFFKFGRAIFDAKTVEWKEFSYAIGSNTNREYAEILLERSGLYELFRLNGYEGNIVLREDVKNPKPSPDMWIETARRMGINPDEQIIFEDSPIGVEAGMLVGAYCIGMPTDNRRDAVIALVNAGAKRVFMNWDEISPDDLLSNACYEHGR